MSVQLQPLKSLAVPVDGLQAYMQQVNAEPLLSAEEEYSLAKRFREEGDLLAAQRLVLSHLRYVVRIAKMYSGYGLQVADLIQEGSIGLMKAVKRFDPDMKVRLVSFAVHWIKSEIHEFVIRNWRIVKVATTKAQRKLFFKLRQAKRRLGWFSQQEVLDVANDLGVTPKDVMEMENRLNAHDASFDMDEDDDGENVSPSYYLSAPQNADPAYSVLEGNSEEEAQAQLQVALQTLDPRTLDIVSKRWLQEPKASLKELAQSYDISLERVRQLENAGLKKLRTVFPLDGQLSQASSAFE
ncbi:RNA polymerase sigma factor RpoH [Candidatus Berkiella aquae]|uniref:RNA polymerase sigma factor n=1 Tax=Candidatus Berkiella aquae TaxID=295108 RepID=A0A0Q9YZF9_9GAMM|nr:RNA polymerase sigma factor RpoH [Candidatus Berkiella aquae]MCS5712684.1 RNA polymerase sigma factor RpoH [Candidatus Berkiella aquae]